LLLLTHRLLGHRLLAHRLLAYRLLRNLPILLLLTERNLSGHGRILLLLLEAALEVGLTSESSALLERCLDFLNVVGAVVVEISHLLVVQHPEVFSSELILNLAQPPYTVSERANTNGADEHVLGQILACSGFVSLDLPAHVETEGEGSDH